MEIKKSKKADLENKRGMFMEIGLVAALAVVIILFSVSQREKIIAELDLGGIADEVEVVDVTTEKEPETVPVQQQTVAVITDILNVVRNDTQIETSFSFVEEFDEDINITPIEVEQEEIEEETIFIVADQKPTFQGGDLNTFRNWVQSRLQYPELARENNIQGTVNITFVVERDGSLTGITVLRSPDKTLSDEAMRVLAKSPKWSPARQRDQAVRFRYTMPIVFKLAN